MNEYTSPLVPVRTGWFKSSRSNPSQTCVEVCFDNDQVLIRDSKQQGRGPIIATTSRQWVALITTLTDDAS